MGLEDQVGEALALVLGGLGLVASSGPASTSSVVAACSKIVVAHSSDARAQAAHHHHPSDSSPTYPRQRIMQALMLAEELTCVDILAVGSVPCHSSTRITENNCPVSLGDDCIQSYLVTGHLYCLY